MPELIPLTGYYYPNKMGYILLLALEEELGRDNLNTILQDSQLTQYLSQLPAKNYERQFDFAHIANLLHSLETHYGPRGSRTLSLRTGQTMFEQGLKNFGDLAGVTDPAFIVLPLSTKLKVGLPAIARIFTQLSDQITHVVEQPDHYLYYIDRCPICWGRRAEQPICHLSTSILQSALRWVSGGLQFRVEEINCIAMGDPSCVFKVDKEPVK